MTADNYASVEAWRMHLSAEGVPQVHFVEAATCDLSALIQASTELGFAMFQIDGHRIRTTNDFMDEVAAAVQFPSYFGRNWNAVLDLLTDLSWVPARGYVLAITAGEDLLRMGNRDVGAFIRAVESAIREWRDERGEYSERTTSIPFHLVLCGTRPVRAALSGVLTEPLCEHLS